MSKFRMIVDFGNRKDEGGYQEDHSLVCNV